MSCSCNTSIIHWHVNHASHFVIRYMLFSLDKQMYLCARVCVCRVPKSMRLAALYLLTLTVYACLFVMSWQV